MAAEPSFAAILFTDIVGSTERASELGDAGWRELLIEHHAVVRREIRRFGGREANTAGDGFLATFDRAAPAIRCAWAIRESVRELGLEVRSGVHTAEVEGHGRDLGGIGVHIGARVAAQASPGEILVSSTARELVTGAGFRFEDRGIHVLKGVPGEWHLYALAGLPASSTSRRTGRWVPELTARHAVVAALVVLAVVAIVAGGRLIRRGDPPALTPEEALAADAAPGIAVLPFATSGPGLDVWREGVIDLVSTNIDGAAGLRAIDTRTVLARWREAVPEGTSPDLATALGVARRTGARYALVGDAVTLGADVRLAADVYDARTGRRLGTAQTQGPPDSVYALVDRLSIEILRTILGGDREGELPRVDLARVTTSSLPALKAYLEGEALFRGSQFEEAIGPYRRAIEADSTFALALLHLSMTHGWADNVLSDLQREYAERAARFADRLPEREALLVRAQLALDGGTLDGIEPLRRAVRQYPDDAELWYLLGDTYFHLGYGALVGEEEAERAFERAIALDPSFAPSYIHAIDYAFLQADSARATELVGALGRIGKGTPVEIRRRLALALAWGSPTDAAAARAALDTIEIRGANAVGFLLIHPRFVGTAREVTEAARRREDATFSTVLWLTFARVYSGRLGDLVGSMDDPLMPAEGRAGSLYWVHDLGWPVPPDRLDRALAVAMTDTAPGTAFLYAAARSVEKSRWEEFESIAARARGDADRHLAAGDTVEARYTHGLLQAMDGYRAWRRGDRDRAIELLQRGRRETVGVGPRLFAGLVIGTWHARVLAEAGRTSDAILAYRTLIGGDHNSPISLELGRLYETLGDRDAARQQYELLLVAWRDADPALRPMFEEARQALARLTPMRRG